MFAKSKLPLLGAALILFLSAGAGVAKEDGKKDQDDATLITAVQTARLSLLNAIALAEDNTHGRAIETDVEHEGGNTFYEIKTIAGGRVQETQIDMQKGSILKTENEGLLSRMKDAIDRDDHNAALKAKVTLAQAISAVHTAFGGKVMEVNFKSGKPVDNYKIKLAKEHSIVFVDVNAQDGAMTLLKREQEKDETNAEIGKEGGEGQGDRD